MLHSCDKVSYCKVTEVIYLILHQYWSYIPGNSLRNEYPLITPKAYPLRDNMKILEYRIFHSRTNKSARRHFVKYCCCSCTSEQNCVRKSKGKRRDHCVPWYIQMTTFILIALSKLIRSTFLRFLASTPNPQVCTTPYPLMCTWARCWPRIDSSENSSF